jgi:hypothetical protein
LLWPLWRPSGLLELLMLEMPPRRKLLPYLERFHSLTGVMFFECFLIVLSSPCAANYPLTSPGHSHKSPSIFSEAYRSHLLCGRRRNTLRFGTDAGATASLSAASLANRSARRRSVLAESSSCARCCSSFRRVSAGFNSASAFRRAAKIRKVTLFTGSFIFSYSI